ncbi:hypothetical protein F5146DRAFT_1136799 [Armillaria mellea]|nr:hypothetical protein F5146DRAFT_1136799 [Armillaria mellea]
MLWRQIASAVQNFKLGYNVQRPYPWRGTTPIVCISFVGLTVLLVFVNIPLSAYNVVQELTYSPNDTSSSLPFLNIIPASLRPAAGEFMPQTFRVGDKIQVLLSVFTYVIIEAFTIGCRPDDGNRVTLFPYSNNPLLSCDVLNVSLSLRKEEPVLFSATVSCWIPTYYKMTLSLNHSNIQDRILAEADFRPVHDLDGILIDLEYGWDSENFTITSDNEGELAPTATQNVTGIDLSVFPCCVCTDVSSESHISESSLRSNPYLKDHPPCDNDVAKFQATGMTVYYGKKVSFGCMNFTPGGNFLSPSQELEFPSIVQIVIKNALQAIYSTIRLDLGVIPPNQIFQSPSPMFNESISSVSLFQPWTNGTDPPRCDMGAFYGTGMSEFVVNDSYANCIRQARSDNVLSFLSDIDVYIPRVPSVPYLRPVFRRKPMLLSAISSVFVATFTMVSAIWSLFNFIASSFCRTQIGTQIYYVIDTQLSNAVAQMYLVVRIAAIVQVN